MLAFVSVLAHATGGTAPTQTIAWPSRYDDDPLPRDAVLFVIDESPGQPDPVLVTAADVPVGFTTHLLDDTRARTWRALVPDAELVPGETYVVRAGYESVAFEVEDRLADSVGAPSPYRRWRTAGCSGDRLQHRVCGAGLLHLVATGASEPPVPTLADPAGALVGSIREDTFDVPVGAWPVTVWVGDLDEAGQFGGWWPADTAERPAADDEVVADAPAGTSATAGTTLTSVTSCPTFTGWDVLETYDCGPTDLVTESVGCGCGGEATPSVALLALVALGSRPGPPRSSPRSRRDGSSP